MLAYCPSGGTSEQCPSPRLCTGPTPQSATSWFYAEIVYIFITRKYALVGSVAYLPYKSALVLKISEYGRSQGPTNLNVASHCKKLIMNKI